MRKTVLQTTFIFLIIGHFALAQKSSLEIPAGGSLELDYANYEMYELQLKNKSIKDIKVQVEDKTTGQFVRGFGLGPLGKVEVMVEATSKIIFTNPNNNTVGLSIKVKELDAQKVMRGNEGLISFKLINSSSESIPLIIPTVMNPNLSPNSSSGVDLKIGQELLFRNKGKRYILFTVDESITEGQEIDVYKLLQERKKALGLR